MTSAFSWQNSISLCPASFHIPNLQLHLARCSWKGMAYGFYSSFIKSWKNYIQIHWNKEKRIIHLGLIVYFYGYRKKKKMLSLVFPWLWIHKRMKPIFSIEIEIQISVGNCFLLVLNALAFQNLFLILIFQRAKFPHYLNFLFPLGLWHLHRLFFHF